MISCNIESPPLHTNVFVVLDSWWFYWYNNVIITDCKICFKEEVVGVVVCTCMYIWQNSWSKFIWSWSVINKLFHGTIAQLSRWYCQPHLECYPVMSLANLGPFLYNFQCKKSRFGDKMLRSMTRLSYLHITNSYERWHLCIKKRALGASIWNLWVPIDFHWFE